MSLLSRLRENRASDKVATATAATFAPQEQGKERTVASVAVATSLQELATSPKKNRPGDVETASCWWLIHFTDRDSVKVACCPEATRAEILGQYPNAVKAEPFTPTIRHPSAPLTASEEMAIRVWLTKIGETDPATVEQVVDQCQQDADARKYFLSRVTTLGA